MLFFFTQSKSSRLFLPPPPSSMASFYFLLSFLCFFHQAHARLSFFQQPLLLPVTKDLSTQQYITQISHGSSQLPTSLVFDLSAPFLSLDCSSSVSRHLIPSCSIQCSMARSFRFVQNSCDHLSSCDICSENGIMKLAEDIITIRSVDGSKSGINVKISNFLFACAPASLLNGLAGGVRGLLGLGRTQIALHSQLASTLDFRRKFSVCLSSSNGVVVFGNVVNDLISDPEILKSLSYTPLIKNPDGSSQEYFIKVRSIKVNGKRLALGQDGIGLTKISTVVPYTTFETSIYETFVKAYSKAANSVNLTRVASVAPFGLCFSSKGVERSTLGPVVPAIDLILQSEMVKWRLDGGNSMVEVKDEVMCVGILDGGLGSKNSVVIGGLQLEDTLLEFDLDTSMLGISSPFLMRRSSCSNLLLDSTVESL